jgi:hypothetical protein
MATKPGRFDSGVQMSTGTAAWNGSTGVGGLYYKTGVGLVMRKTDNSEVTLGAGGAGGTLATTYSSGASTADSILSLDSTRGKILIKDNAAPIGTLFEIQSSGGTSYYLFNASNMTFGVNRGIATSAGNAAFDFSNATGIFKTSTGSHTFGSAVWFTPANLAVTGAASSTNTTAMTLTPNVADGASSIALKVNNTAALSTAGAKLLSLQSNGVEQVGVTLGALNLVSSSFANFGFQNTNGSGAVGQGTSLWLYSANIATVEVLSGNYARPSADNGLSMGDRTVRWGNVYNGGSLGGRYNSQSGTTYSVIAGTGNGTLGDHYVGLTNTAARTVTLPAANTCAAGQMFWIKDEACTAGTGNVTINRSSTDTIITTTTGNTSVVINTNGGKVGLVCDGVSKWQQVF